MTIKKIPESIIKKLEQKYETRRAIYTSLRNKGYSYAQIAKVYDVNPRTVWERLHDRYYSPKEKVK